MKGEHCNHQNSSGIVYKYRSWDNDFHRRLLSEDELYIPTPKELNDPTDCAPKTNFLLLTTEEVEDYIRLTIAQCLPRIRSLGLDEAERAIDLRERMKNLEEFQSHAQEIELQTFEGTFGIVSLANHWANHLLWAHYANAYKGFCLGLFSDKLQATGSFAKADWVCYHDQLPEIHPLEMENDEKIRKRFFPN